MAYITAEESVASLDADLDNVFDMQKQVRKEEILGEMRAVKDRYDAKIEKIKARGGKRMAAKLAHEKEQLQSEFAEYKSELADLTEPEGDEAEEAEEKTVYKTSFMTKVKRAGLAALVAALGFQGAALGDGIAPLEKYMPVKRVEVQEGQNLYRIAEQAGLSLDAITSKYAEKIANFDPRSDVHAGDVISAIGYDDAALVGVDPAYD